MAAVGQTQWYKSCLLIGNTAYPAYAGARMMFPQNYIIPPIIGNYWQWNYGRGLRQPMVEVQLCLRDIATEVLALPFMNLWLTRSNDVAHDTTTIANGVSFWNGRRGFTMTTAKADSFTLGSSGGGELRFTARFVGGNVTPMVGAPVFAGWNKDNVLTFANVNFAEPFASAVWNWNLSYSNNHNPDLSHNGTPFPTNQNAGMMTAGFNALMQGASTPDILMPNGGGSFPAPTTPDEIVFTVGGANVTRTFTLNNPIINNPDDLTAAPPRVMQEYQFLCLGADSQITPPLSIT